MLSRWDTDSVRGQFFLEFCPLATLVHDCEQQGFPVLMLLQGDGVEVG